MVVKASPYSCPFEGCPFPVPPLCRLYLVGLPLHDAVASEVAWFTSHPGGGSPSIVVDELLSLLALGGEVRAAVAAADTLQV
jgi:hypothetical protein